MNLNHSHISYAVLCGISILMVDLASVAIMLIHFNIVLLHWELMLIYF